MSLTISVITPSFNQGRFIEATILSVLKQNIPLLDYVVVDGGSTDNTLTVLQHYRHRLRYVSEPDNGQTHAINKGLAMTQGDIIGWVNSDDIYYPGTIETILDYFNKHPDADVVYGNANMIDAKDELIAPFPVIDWNFKQLKETCFIAQPALFFRRSVVERFGLLNEKLHFCMDYEYWIRLAKGGAHFAYINQLFAGARIYPETKTASAPLQAQAEILPMLKHHLGYVPARWLLRHAYCIVRREKNMSLFDPRFVPYVMFTAVSLAFKWNPNSVISTFLQYPNAGLEIMKERTKKP
ncbi:MAG: glycosyltransferase family 2 protein [Gammaproteobacteria bacterium]